MQRQVKVIHVITRMIRGGAQKICLGICGGIDKTKYDITLVTGPSKGIEGDLMAEAKQTDIKLIYIPELVRDISPLKDMIALLKLIRLFAKERPALVHTHTSKAGFIGCLAARLMHIPVIIYSSHGHIFSRIAHIPGVSGNPLRIKLLYWLRRFASWCSTKIIALNQADKKEQIQLKLAPVQKYEIIHNGIDPVTHFTETKRDKEYNGRDPLLACVGRLVPEKGHQFLIKAIKPIKDKHSSVLLLIIGDGELRNKLEGLTTSYDLKDNIRFLGLRTDVSRLLSQVDLVVVPSLYESFGLVLLEAMAQKKPVIASAINGIPEIIEDGKSGVLVPPADSEALANAVINLVQNQTQKTQIGQAGFQRLMELFTTQRMISNTELLYQRLLTTRNIN